MPLKASLQLLLCSDLDGAELLDVQLRDAPDLHIAAMAETGGEALAKARKLLPDGVVVAGDIDGCHGVRIAAAMSRERQLPTVLLVEPADHASVRREVARRELDSVHVLACDPCDPRPGTVASGIRTSVQMLIARSRVPGSWSLPQLQARGEILALAERAFDVVVLLGSAGTPHMLPRLLGKRRVRDVPLVVAVHHNPSLSQSFCTWVRQLHGHGTRPIVVDTRTPPEARASGLTVIGVEAASSAAEQLAPDLGRVLDGVLERDLVPLVCVASGMGVQGIDAMRRARQAGGEIVALNPSDCSAPSMVEAVLGCGLVGHVVSVDELAWLIANAGRGSQQPLLAVAS